MKTSMSVTVNRGMWTKSERNTKATTLLCCFILPVQFRRPWKSEETDNVFFRFSWNWMFRFFFKWLYALCTHEYLSYCTSCIERERERDREYRCMCVCAWMCVCECGVCIWVHVCQRELKRDRERKSARVFLCACQKGLE